jgi:four helix bundle suffix protein
MTNPGQPESQSGFIPPHGGYAGLKAYQMSVPEDAPPEVSANTMLCLVHQTNYLLDQLLRQLEQAFLKEGGFTERLYQARQQARALPPRPNFGRSRPNPAYPSSPPSPNP